MWAGRGSAPVAAAGPLGFSPVGELAVDEALPDEAEREGVADPAVEGAVEEPPVEPV
jgi:hypothetical protein